MTEYITRVNKCQYRNSRNEQTCIVQRELFCVACTLVAHAFPMAAGEVISANWEFMLPFYRPEPAHSPFKLQRASVGRSQERVKNTCLYLPINLYNLSCARRGHFGASPGAPASVRGHQRADPAGHRCRAICPRRQASV